MYDYLTKEFDFFSIGNAVLLVLDITMTFALCLLALYANKKLHCLSCMESCYVCVISVERQVLMDTDLCGHLEFIFNFQVIAKIILPQMTQLTCYIQSLLDKSSFGRQQSALRVYNVLLVSLSVLG